MGSNRDYLISLLKEGVDGVLKYKAENGMFYQLTDLGDSKLIVPYNYLEELKNKAYADAKGQYRDTEISNYTETSGSAMIAYVLIKAVKSGYLSSEYLSVGYSVFESIYKNALVANGNSLTLNNICITAGLGPEEKTVRDGSPFYYLAEPVGSDDAKGVGPFLMAFMQYAGA